MRVLTLFIFLTTFGHAQVKHEPVKIAGHRGGYYFQYPESSLSLLNYLSKAFGADTLTVEIDLRRSKDGTIWIMHDETVDRTTNGSGKITALNDDYIRKLVLKKEDGSLTKEHVPTFEQVLKLIRKRNLNLMLDIKTPIHQEVYALLKKYNIENRMLTLTFNMDLTKQVALLSQKVQLSALIESEENWKQFKEVALPNGKKIAYVNNKTPQSLIEALKSNNILIMTDVSEALRYNNKPLEGEGYINKVKAQQLNILITDYPIEARKNLYQ